MSFSIRAITRHDVPAMVETMGLVFGFDGADEAVERWGELVPFDRFACVWEGDLIIGTGVSIDSSLSLPGGAVVPIAAITIITVRPTHRRRGVLTAMMGKLFDDALA